jgi:hypothetical protein
MQKSRIKTKVNKLLQLMFDNNIEIVSYGIAPNPNGFCFEVHNPRAPAHVIKYVSKELDSLNQDQVQLLKSIVFN